MGDLGQYFNRSEFECQCENPECHFDEISELLIWRLDEIRKELNKPLIVTSGCRCQAHNADIRGSINSAHLRGKAVDIQVTTARDRFIVLQQLLRFDVTRIGIGEDFIHFDMDTSLTQNVIWRY